MTVKEHNLANLLRNHGLTRLSDEELDAVVGASCNISCEIYCYSGCSHGGLNSPPPEVEEPAG
jgi:hypothetical protein